jgi:Ca-activated chloride channel family protein
MPSRDFNDDAKDGGEIGYGHVVTAVYEIEPGKAEESLDAHFSKIKPTGGQKELCNVRLRYKLLEEATSEEENYVLANESEMTENSLLQTIIAFGLLLRKSAFKGMCSEELLRELVGKLQNSKQELELKTAIKSFLDTRL